MNHSSRTRGAGIGVATLVAIVALLVPTIALAATVTVTAIPGKGWIQGPDNNAADAVIAKSPVAGLGKDSVKLVQAADSDFVGIGRPIVAPLSDLTAGSWRTYVTGDTGTPASETATLRFGMYRLGGLSGFTTMSVAPADNGTVTAGAWQTWSLSDTTVVWQTTDDGGFCIITAPCTFADFKTKYPDANLLGLQVAIGTGTPATTSYVDGVSLTAAGTTNTWNFERAAAPTPTPPPGVTVTVPPTDVAMPATTPSSIRGEEVLVFLGALLAVVVVATSWRPARRRR
jgi:hypothetical protein